MAASRDCCAPDARPTLMVYKAYLIGKYEPIFEQVLVEHKE
jgi:hypothetical protein